MKRRNRTNEKIIIQKLTEYSEYFQKATMQPE